MDGDGPSEEDGSKVKMGNDMLTLILSFEYEWSVLKRCSYAVNIHIVSRSPSSILYRWLMLPKDVLRMSLDVSERGVWPDEDHAAGIRPGGGVVLPRGPVQGQEDHAGLRHPPRPHQHGRAPLRGLHRVGPIDLLLISHFHLDHAGALPWFLQKTTFRGKCYMTHATKAIFFWLLSDYIKVSYRFGVLKLWMKL